MSVNLQFEADASHSGRLKQTEVCFTFDESKSGHNFFKQNRRIG
jgi:hypothetical protein